MALNVPTHIPDDREAALLRAAVTPFPSVAAAGDAIASVFDSFGSDPGVRVLLIGDGSHGTSEFYAMRAEITKYMIQHHGFNIVAVEADWPDAEAVDRYVRRRGTGPGPKKGKGGKVAAVKKDDEDGETMRDPVPEMPGEHVEQEPREPPFLRFPTWMWRNTEFRAFVEWLRGWNHDKEMHDAVGFYGLDLYSLGASMRAVIKYLDQVDKPMADMARKGYEKLMVWSEHPQEYGLHTIVSGFKGYEKDVLKILKDLLSKRLEYSAAHWNGIEFHSAEQNARLVRGE